MRDSLAARAGPLALLGVALLPFVGAVRINTVSAGLWGVLALAVLAALVVRDVRRTWWRLGIALLAAGSVALSTWLYGGQDPDATGGAALRILYLVVPGAIVSPYLEPNQLGDHLAQRLRVPARAVVASVAALQRLDQLVEQWQLIVRARRARGMGLDGGVVNRARVGASVAFALLVSTMRMSGRMSVAMDARGFAAARRRTWAEPAPWHAADTLVLALGLGLALLPWVVVPVSLGG